jgi:hypothetical protein
MRCRITTRFGLRARCIVPRLRCWRGWCRTVAQECGRRQRRASRDWHAPARAHTYVQAPVGATAHDRMHGAERTLCGCHRTAVFRYSRGWVRLAVCVLRTDGKSCQHWPRRSPFGWSAAALVQVSADHSAAYLSHLAPSHLALSHLAPSHLALSHLALSHLAPSHLALPYERLSASLRSPLHTNRLHLIEAFGGSDLHVA